MGTAVHRADAAIVSGHFVLKGCAEEGPPLVIGGSS